MLHSGYIMTKGIISVYVVNHKDHDKENNNIDNFEWITIKDNIIHGVGKRVAKIDKTSNKIIKIYNSIKKACNELKEKSCQNVTSVCKGKNKTAFGFKWKYID